MCTLERQQFLQFARGNADRGMIREDVITKVPTGTALRRVRDAINAEIFLSTDPIVNGDIDVMDLCVDIRRTVQSAVQLRIGIDNYANNYRIYFF